MSIRPKTITVATTAILAALMTIAPLARADHSLGPSYHWARQANPFTLTVVDSMTSDWDAHLDLAEIDWDLTPVLDLNQQEGSTAPKDRQRCQPVRRMIRACNAAYGTNGWLGYAQITIDKSGHISQATARVNDTYVGTSTYNTPAWRQYLACHEIGHTLGLAHRDIDKTNPNLGTCMDYTNNPAGPLSNEHPDAHDYQQVDASHSHTDSSSTSSSSAGDRSNGQPSSTHVRNDGHGTVITHILWA